MSSRQVGRSIPCLVFIHLQGLGSSQLADHLVNEISCVKTALSFVNLVKHGAYSIFHKFHFSYFEYSGRYTSKTATTFKALIDKVIRNCIAFEIDCSEYFEMPIWNFIESRFVS